MKFQHIPEQYVRTKADKKFLNEGGTFDITKGQRVVDFIQTYMRTTRGYGAGDPITLLPWQVDLFIPLFSWLKPNGFRRFRECLCATPRQNGKSFIGSCCSLAMLLLDNEPGPDIMLLGTTAQQTRVVFDEILHTVRSSPKLAEVLVAKPSIYEIEYPARQGRIKGLSREGLGKLGRPPHLALFDEFCLWQDYKPYVSLKHGTGTRNQNLFLYTSTSGTNRGTPGYDIWRYAEGILDSANDDVSFFPVLYASKPDEPINDPATYRKCNPTAIYSPALEEELARQMIRASKSKQDELHWRQYRLNQWTASTNTWIPIDAFYACKTEPWPDLSQQEAYVGVDLSSSGTDLTSVVAIVPYQGRYYVDHHSFTSRRAVDRTAEDGVVKYAVFESEGTLTVHEGDVVDYDDIRQYIVNLASKYQVNVVAVDPAHNAAALMLQLVGDGLPVQKFINGPHYFNGPMNRLNELCLDGTLAHKGDSLINWQAANLEGKKGQRDLVMPHKPNDSAKIDTFVAMLQALYYTITGEAVESTKDEGILWW